MEQRCEKFKTSRQPAVQLQIALEDFFLPELPEEIRAVYGTYLRQRIRPAVEILIRQEALGKLDALRELGWFPLSEIDDFLRIARTEHKNAAFVWLLRRKQEETGFRLPDFSL